MDEQLYDDENYADVGNDQVSINQVRELVGELQEADLEVLEVEQRLADATQRQQRISRDILPKAFQAAGVSEIVTDSGDKVTIVEKVRGSIYKDKRPEGHAWLEEHGEGGKIKRKVVLDCGQADEEYVKNLGVCLADVLEASDESDQEDAILRLEDILRNELASHIDVAVETKIEPSSLSAFIRRCLQKGDIDLPEDIFSVYQHQETKIKTAKKRRSE